MAKVVQEVQVVQVVSVVDGVMWSGWSAWMIYNQKTSGLHFLNHKIVWKSLDVTPVAERDTLTYKVKVVNYSV